MEIDVSTMGGALLISVLRLLHIVGGLIWVGAALMMSFFIEPAAAKAGADGSRFLRALYRSGKWTWFIPAAALVTTLAGLLLYELLSYSAALRSWPGLVITTGSIFGMLAFLHGLFAPWRLGIRYARAAGKAVDEEKLTELEAKLRRNGRVSMCLALVSLLLMASARYIGPVLG